VNIHIGTSSLSTPVLDSTAACTWILHLLDLINCGVYLHCLFSD